MTAKLFELYYQAISSQLAVSLFNGLLSEGCRLTRPKWLGSIALILEIATLFLLSLGCGYLIEYSLAKPAH